VAQGGWCVAKSISRRKKHEVWRKGGAGDETYFSASNAYLASLQNSSRAIMRGLKKEINAGQSFLLKMLVSFS
jgi:hypothetical protein